MIGSYLSALGFMLGRGIAAAGRSIWSFMRPGVRFLSAVLLVAAIIALTMDVTRWQTGAAGPTFESLAGQIRAAAPATLDGIGQAISATLHPLFWDPLLTSVLALPAWLIFAALCLLLNYAARDRHEVNIFIN